MLWIIMQFVGYILFATVMADKWRVLMKVVFGKDILMFTLMGDLLCNTQPCSGDGKLDVLM